MKVITIIPLLFLMSCASIISGQNQNISVTTTPPSKCTLINNSGTWFVSSPGSVNVQRSFSSMNIKCKTDKKTGVTSVGTGVNPWILGNIVFGGVIGLAIDGISGAAFRYPNLITIPMSKGK